ncbi:hypothetical protein BJX70DRAFT_406232 [Aspergillus crustosus]
MPPPRGTPNILEGPGDYDVTTTIHNDTYPAIDPTKVSLKGKAVFVSGASRGMGREMVLSFARGGASYIAAGARSDLSQLAEDVRSAAQAANHPEPTFLPLQLDVTSVESVEKAAAKVDEEFGHLDIAINNAGVLGKFGLVHESKPEEWLNVLNINLIGPYLVSRSFIPLLLKGQDQYLINVASVAAHLTNPTLSAYQTSKVALVRLTQLLDKEYSSHGVTCFSIHPGNSPTDIMGGPDGMNEHEKLVFTETPKLSADTLVYLTSEKRQWLGGRYVNVTWDMPELMRKEEEIVSGDKLKVRLVY